MFNNNTSSDTKIAVLEERLSSYEIMLKKIDEAIQIMGKTSQNISKMLAVHEEKIEQCHKADDYITRVIDELRIENKDQHEEVSKRIEKLENKIEEFVKYRWIIVGVFAVTTFAFSQSHFVVDFLTPNQQPARIERTK
jgi:chromosome segregation ATPase